MGYAIAEALAENGAKVTLVSGPTHLKIQHPGIELINVMQAEDMYQQCIKVFPSCHGAVMSAAVADFTPVQKANQKTKRGKENWHIELEPTQDIAATLGAMKVEKQLLVGFALETNNEEFNAQKKLASKNLDFIVLNSLQVQGAGFQHDTNKITIFDRLGYKIDYPLKSKKQVAEDIVNKIITYFDTEV
jgi:phosphopantothenoylcysteine decarboxylase/phosphopantothenate--cysteine ligase